jgi:hypothetical protein
MFYYILLLGNIGLGLNSLAHQSYGQAAASLGVAAFMAFVAYTTRRSSI